MRFSAYSVALIVMALLAVQLSFAAVSSSATSTPNAPSFNITSPALAICRGEVNNIPITVSNLGYSPAVAYGQGSPSSLGPQMQQVVLSVNGKGLYSYLNSNGNNNVNPDNSLTIYVPTFVNANASSLIFGSVSITYNFLSFYSDSETRNVTFVTERCPVPLSVNATPGTLISDQSENLTLNLTNTGNTILTNLLIHIVIPGQEGGVLVNQPIQVNSIVAHHSTLLNESINIYGNASSSFPINITTTFYNGSTLEQVLNNRFFLATGLIELTPSSVTVSPATSTPGGIFSMSFVLTDIGTAGATGMSATALPTKGFTTFGSNSIFIGSITADGQSSVTLSQKVSNDTKPGIYTIPVRVNYLNNLRQNLSTVVNVTMIVSGATGNLSSSGAAFRSRTTSSSGGGINIILLLIIVVLFYLYYKERKKAGRPLTLEPLRKFYNDMMKYNQKGKKV